MSQPSANDAVTTDKKFHDELRFTPTATQAAWRWARVDASRAAWQKSSMSVLNTVKDAVVGQAMRLMSDPRLSRMMGNPKVVNAAMKAMNLGGSVKAEMDKATRFAASVFGFATQDEVSALKSTVQTLEDQIAIMQSKSAHSRPGDGS